jgi:hypothetical protein
MWRYFTIIAEIQGDVLGAVYFERVERIELFFEV